MKIGQLLKRVEKIDVAKISAQAIKQTTDDLINAQKEQLYDGLDSTGFDIEPEYTQRTIEIKESKGQPYDRVTLNDTGAWYAGLQADVRSGKVIMKDVDPKTADLFKKYGPRILGVGGFYKSSYIANKLNPVFQNLMQNAIGLRRL